MLAMARGDFEAPRPRAEYHGVQDMGRGEFEELDAALGGRGKWASVGGGHNSSFIIRVL